MTHTEKNPAEVEEAEHYPVEPYYHPVGRLARAIYDRLASSRLAMGLFVAILISCICGGVFFKSEEAHRVIYDSLWFNGFLVLLVVNTACCFFGRIRGRRVTIISFGMILFHLSFVAMFLAIVFNSLFYFDGLLRLTEGETVSNADRKVYDSQRYGMFFSFSRLKGTLTLNRFHRGFKVDGDEKNIAYELSVATPGAPAQQGLIYINHKFVSNGIEYFRDREGYSLLLILQDARGKELYGGHYPLQSIRQADGSYLYTTGSSTGPDRINFPLDQEKPLLSIQSEYSSELQNDRNGKVRFQVWPPRVDAAGGAPHANGAGGAAGAHGGGAEGHASGMPAGGGHSPEMVMAMDKNQPKLADATVNVGEKVAFGGYQLAAPEVRYWVGMNVRYNPGKPVVLTSLWTGFAGLIITMIGRLLRARKQSN